MTIRKTGVIFECEHSGYTGLDWSHCSENTPFQSISEKETRKHEKSHFESIAKHKEMLLQRKDAVQILTKALIVREWKDWEKIYELGRQFSIAVNSQGLIQGQSIITWDIAMRLEHSLKKLIWEQTKDGKIIKRQGVKMQLTPMCSKLFKVLEAGWSTDKETAKDGFEHLMEMKMLIQEISKEIGVIKMKHSQAHETCDEIEKCIFQTIIYIDHDRARLESRTA